MNEMVEKTASQHALVAFDSGGAGFVVEFKGDDLQRACDEYDLNAVADDTQSPGLHVWSGRVRFGGESGYYELDGAWRRVTPDEAIRWARRGRVPWQEWKRCVVERHRLDGVTETYCGRETSVNRELLLTGPKHARACVETENRLVLCPECLVAMKTSGAWARAEHWRDEL